MGSPILAFQLFFNEQLTPDLTKTYLEILSAPDHVLSSSELKAIGLKSIGFYDLTSATTLSINGKRAVLTEWLCDDYYKGMDMAKMEITIFDPDGRRILGFEYYATTGTFEAHYHTAKRVIYTALSGRRS